MTDLKKDSNDSRTPYEPPRLFNLGDGLAYAQVVCTAGGLPGGVQCTSGGTALGGKCQNGATAPGYVCQAGGVPLPSCKAGKAVG